MTRTERLARLAEATELGGFFKTERDTEIRSLYAEGVSVTELTEVTGLTRQRIWQIVRNQ